MSTYPVTYDGDNWSATVSGLPYGSTTLYVSASSGEVIELVVLIPVELPTELSPGTSSGGTGEVSGNDVILDSGEFIEWTVDAKHGGPCLLNVHLTSGASGVVAVMLDGVTVETANYPGTVSLAIMMPPGIHVLRIQEMS